MVLSVVVRVVVGPVVFGVVVVGVVGTGHGGNISKLKEKFNLKN